MRESCHGESTSFIIPDLSDSEMDKAPNMLACHNAQPLTLDPTGPDSRGQGTCLNNTNRLNKITRMQPCLIAQPLTLGQNYQWIGKDAANLEKNDGRRGNRCSSCYSLNFEMDSIIPSSNHPCSDMPHNLHRSNSPLFSEQFQNETR